jgi:uncharacterized membrane protein
MKNASSKVISLTFILFFFSIKFAATQQADRILSFHSDIIIDTSGTIKVTETIKVYNGSGGENDLIQRGIVRTFPTKYKTKEGLISNVPFKLLESKRNGDFEPNFMEKHKNGFLLYLGQSHVILEEGIHENEITYQTGKQLIFHEDKDEFYWNVNGNGWQFTADVVSCKITFPVGTEIFENQCYTGPAGSTDRICSFKQLAPNVIYFQTENPLDIYEGLTVAAAVNKGFFKYPTKTEQYIDLLKDNIILPILLLFVLFIFCINLWYWLKHGKDPAKGVIYPQFDPPVDLSPADVGYILKQNYSPQFFAAAIVDYAVNKLVKIDVDKAGILFKTPVYKFLRPDRFNLDNYERDYKRYGWYGFDIDTLFNQSAQRGVYNSSIAGCNSTLSRTLEQRFLISKGVKNTIKGLFKLNTGFIALGVFLIIAMIVGTIVFLSMSSNALLITASIILLVLSVAIHGVFSSIMSAYTPEGRKLVDHILGFKMYLETTEQRIFDKLNPPEMTLQLFEKYLPYAIALDCENEWSKKFESVINAAILNGYQPTYYTSTFSSFNANSFTQGMASGLSGTISSASTPPSSSSGGSSGGGFSGGGGGGGGGGGW